MSSRPSEQNTNAPADQRYFPRWKSQNPILYKSETDPELRHGQTTDLSCAGACLSLKEQLPLNRKLALTVRLTPKISVELHGVVVWQNGTGATYLTGVSFYETSDVSQDLILQHAFELNRPKVLEHWYKGWDGH